MFLETGEVIVSSSARSKTVYEACTAELEKNDVFALDSPMFQRNINGIESTGGLVSDFHGDNRGSNPLRDANLQQVADNLNRWGQFFALTLGLFGRARRPLSHPSEAPRNNNGNNSENKEKAEVEDMAVKRRSA